MSTTTTHYSLVKPAVGEYYGIGVHNTNYDTIDTTLYAKLDKVNAKWKITDEGGYAIKLTNKTGGASVKGTVVSVSATTDNAFRVNPIDGDMPIGVVYESAVADGSECFVVVSGIAEVLLVNTVAATRSYIAYSSATVAGRIDTLATAPAATTHFREIGHTLENKTGGTDVLVKVCLHFN